MRAELGLAKRGLLADRRAWRLWTGTGAALSGLGVRVRAWGPALDISATAKFLPRFEQDGGDGFSAKHDPSRFRKKIVWRQGSKPLI